MQISFTLLFLGLSASGKSSLIASYLNSTNQVFPTAGFSIHYLTIGLKQALIYDCSGQGHSRPLWSFLQPYCNGVVYVIDAYDGDRFSNAKDALYRFLQKNKDMRAKVLCIMLNKSDIGNRIAKDVLYRGLEIERMAKMVGKIYVKETSAYTKDGIEECLDWVSKNVRSQ